MQSESRTSADFLSKNNMIVHSNEEARGTSERHTCPAVQFNTSLVVIILIYPYHIQHILFFRNYPSLLDMCEFLQRQYAEQP